MQLANSKTRYGAAPQLIHWLTALFVIVGWLLGQFGDDLPKGAVRAFGLLAHMTLGECVVALLVIRLGWRFANPPPPPEPNPFGPLVTAAATLSHYTLYALLIVVPLAGMMVQLKRGHDLPIFAVAGRSRHRPERPDRAPLSCQRAPDPRRHSCGRRDRAPLAVARPDAGAHVARRGVMRL
jgi:cytochrome b561